MFGQRSDQLGEEFITDDECALVDGFAMSK